jgi:hypothetical protein
MVTLLGGALHSLKKQEIADATEKIEKSLEKAQKGEHISILDLMPDDFGEILRRVESYSYWEPPGDSKIAEERLIGNLASFLSRPEVRGTQRIVAPLVVARSKAEFKHKCGLAEGLGVTFERFKQLVEEGRLMLKLSGDPARYRADFYKDLFTACERAGYTPPFSSLRIDQFVRLVRLIELAAKEGVPPEEGWQDLVLNKYPYLDLKKCLEDVNAILNEEVVRKLKTKLKTISMEEEDSIQAMLASDLFSLRAWGFGKIAYHGLELMKKDAVLGASILSDFKYYTVGGVDMALGGLRLFDDADASAMVFLGLKPVELPCPASLSLASQKSIECSVITEPDRYEVEGFLKKGSDIELASCVREFQRAANDYDLVKAIDYYERLGIIVSERYDEEVKDWFRRSKIMRGTVHGGLILTSSAITSFLSIHPGLNLLLNILLNISQRLLQEHVERLSGWLVEKWPFAEKGLPFFLWKYGIKPEG